MNLLTPILERAVPVALELHSSLCGTVLTSMGEVNNVDAAYFGAVTAVTLPRRTLLLSVLDVNLGNAYELAIG